ncbi:MAG TPA: arsinothricin resistance N-acetyltransferase ArsN1 family B [Chitinophagaceae bacterium]|nr:arsinothricin resistance N-acetyltransferase ArsN1 family B [Chitinophagaceae bacterium]
MTSIRLATPADAKAILDIYAPYIENTSFTFETEVPSIEEFANRIQTYLLNWPWLLCEVDGKIAGYAYATRHRERTAYQWCTESSVYIHDDFQRAGIARVLYTALFEILKKQGFRNVYAVINLPNDKSVALHESCGFEYFATYEQVGYKLGKWKNVGWWRLILNEFGDEPAAPIKFSELDKDFLAGLFDRAISSIKSKDNFSI